MKYCNSSFLQRNIIILSIVIIFILLKPWKSNFANENGILALLSEKYSSCGDNSRTDPSGNVSGNYLNINDYGKNELLRKFVENGK